MLLNWTIFGTFLVKGAETVRILFLTSYHQQFLDPLSLLKTITYKTI